VQAVAAGLGMRSDEIDRTVELVDRWVASNRNQPPDTRERAAA
jgi:hypothetical protein